MENQKDEITRKIRDKILELFGPESALAQAMEGKPLSANECKYGNR